MTSVISITKLTLLELPSSTMERIQKSSGGLTTIKLRVTPTLACQLVMSSWLKSLLIRPYTAVSNRCSASMARQTVFALAPKAISTLPYSFTALNWGMALSTRKTTLTPSFTTPLTAAQWVLVLDLNSVIPLTEK